MNEMVKDDRVDMTDKHFMCMFGPSGAGKGFLTKCLMKAGVKFHHVSVGEELRNFAKKDCAQAKEVREIMIAGNHVPMDITVRVAFANLGSIEEDLIIIDGFPRSEMQAEYLVSCCEFLFDLDKFTGIHIQRSLCRCLEQVEKSTDRNGREDDNRQGVIDRYNLYRTLTIPAINHMCSAGMHLYDTGNADDLEEIVPHIINSLDLHKFMEKETAMNFFAGVPTLACANFML